MPPDSSLISRSWPVETSAVWSCPPGVYHWSTDVSISEDIVLAGDSDDTWIFQIDGNLTTASGTNVLLAGDVQIENIVWQVAGGAGVEIGTDAQFSGVVLTQTGINVLTGATVNGCLYAQTDVNLQMATVTGCESAAIDPDPDPDPDPDEPDVPDVEIPVEVLPDDVELPVEELPFPIDELPDDVEVPPEEIPDGVEVPVEALPDGVEVPVEELPDDVEVPVEALLDEDYPEDEKKEKGREEGEKTRRGVLE